jgi:hypothetical protein
MGAGTVLTRRSIGGGFKRVRGLVVKHSIALIVGEQMGEQSLSVKLLRIKPIAATREL